MNEEQALAVLALLDETAAPFIKKVSIFDAASDSDSGSDSDGNNGDDCSAAAAVAKQAAMIGRILALQQEAEDVDEHDESRPEGEEEDVDAALDQVLKEIAIYKAVNPEMSSSESVGTEASVQPEAEGGPTLLSTVPGVVFNLGHDALKRWNAEAKLAQGVMLESDGMGEGENDGKQTTE